MLLSGFGPAPALALQEYCYRTYHMHNTKTDSKVTLLSSCIFPPYNIEAAFCQAPKTHLVQLKLVYENCTTLKRQYEQEVPYFLWGNKGSNVLPNTVSLPDGGYYLYTKVDGVTSRIRFTQCCRYPGCAAEPTFAKKCSLKI